MDEFESDPIIALAAKNVLDALDKHPSITDDDKIKVMVTVAVMVAKRSGIDLKSIKDYLDFTSKNSALLQTITKPQLMN